MLVDHRAYMIEPTRVQACLDLHEQRGMAAQMRHPVRPAAHMFSEPGGLDTLVHTRAHEDATEQAGRREAMLFDPEWKAYQTLNSETRLPVEQTTSLIIPASFTPIRH